MISANYSYIVSALFLRTSSSLSIRRVSFLSSYIHLFSFFLSYISSSRSFRSSDLHSFFLLSPCISHPQLYALPMVFYNRLCAFSPFIMIFFRHSSAGFSSFLRLLLLLALSLSLRVRLQFISPLIPLSGP